MKEEEKNNFYSLFSDTTFKYLFKKKVGKEFYCKIFNQCLRLDLSDYEFVDKDFPSGNLYKDYRADNILVSSDKKNYACIEMNGKGKKVDNLNRFYLHRIISYINDNDKDSDRDEIHQININDFYHREKMCFQVTEPVDEDDEIIYRDERIISAYSYRSGIIDEDINPSTINGYNIYLPVFSKSSNDNDKELRLFKCNSYEEMRSIADGDKELLNVIDEIENLNKDKYFESLYNLEEDYKKCNGVIKEAKEEIALKLIDKGNTLKEVSEITGLTEEELEKSTINY